MDDFIKAKQMLSGGEYTAVLCKGERTYTSTLRGVKPLVRWLEDKTDFSGYVAADKVVGKATAFLYLLLNIKAVYAQVISKSALQLLKQYGIKFEYDQLAENIINRQGTGICPFEERVLNLTDRDDAYRAIREKMDEMNITL